MVPAGKPPLYGERPGTSSAPCGGTSHGPNRPVLTGKCPLDIFPGVRTPKGEGKDRRTSENKIDLIWPAYGGPPPMGLTGPSYWKMSTGHFPGRSDPQRGRQKGNDGQLKSSLPLWGRWPSAARSDEVKSVLYSSPFQKPPHRSGEVARRAGGAPLGLAVCRRKPFGQGSATATWARAAVLVCKADRQARPTPQFWFARQTAKARPHTAVLVCKADRQARPTPQFWFAGQTAKARPHTAVLVCRANCQSPSHAHKKGCFSHGIPV